MKRVTYNLSLFKAAEPGADNNSAALIGDENTERERRLHKQYIPVCRVELVRERSIKTESRRAIHNSKDVVALLKDELLKADREKLICLMLSAKNIVIGMEVVSVGTLTSSLASPRLCSAAHNLGYLASYVLWPQIS